MIFKKLNKYFIFNVCMNNFNYFNLITLIYLLQILAI